MADAKDYAVLESVYNDLFDKVSQLEKPTAQACLVNCMWEIYQVIDGHRSY